VTVEDAYELAYREAVRALDHQLAALTELRSRAGMLLATASITMSLLGHETFHGMRSFTWAAILCFALLCVSVLAIVWPHADWNFDFDPRAFLDAELSEERPAPTDLRLALIAHLGHYRDANARRLMHVAHVFRIAACLLAMEIVLTITATSDIV